MTDGVGSAPLGAGVGNFVDVDRKGSKSAFGNDAGRWLSQSVKLSAVVPTPDAGDSPAGSSSFRSPSLTGRETSSRVGSEPLLAKGHPAARLVSGKKSDSIKDFQKNRRGLGKSKDHEKKMSRMSSHHQDGQQLMNSYRSGSVTSSSRLPGSVSSEIGSLEIQRGRLSAANEVETLRRSDSMSSNRTPSGNQRRSMMDSVLEGSDTPPLLESKRWWCLGSPSFRRIDLVANARQLNRSKSFQLSMFIALLCALFLPDIWILANRPSNDDLDVLLTLVLVAFIVEIHVQAFCLAGAYLKSSFFWMDVLGAASLLLDISYVPFSAALSGGDGGGDSVSNSLGRLARIAKLGARAGRFTKIVKLLRYLPGLREGADTGTASNISRRLIHALSTRVSCLIIIMVMIMPMFSMWTYPEQDHSMRSWLVIIERSLLDHPERVDRQLQEFIDFYSRQDLYPWSLKAKDPTRLSSSASANLPWMSPLGAPTRKGNSMRMDTEHLSCEFNFKTPNQVDALLNVLMLLVVMVLIVGFSLVLSRSVSKIVLAPLQNLLGQVRKMASTVFQSVTDIAATEGEEDDGDEEGPNDQGDNPANAFGNETALLDMVVKKLSILGNATSKKLEMESAAMEGLGEGDRAIIDSLHGRGSSTRVDPIWDDPADIAQASENRERSEGEQRAMLEDAGLSLELLNSWNLNPLELDKTSSHAATMYFVRSHTFEPGCDTETVARFLEAVEMGYLLTCHYHNWFHAVDVAHCVYMLLQMCCCGVYLTTAERHALLISAVCHDIGHPGVNNSFVVETSHELAIRYNDKSPLENMHCARMFEILDDATCNVFVALSKRQFQDVRSVCIDAILHTDNALHFGMIKEVRMLAEVNSEVMSASVDLYNEKPESFPTADVVECFKSPDTRRLLVNFFLHYADISNSAKPFRICRIWVLQILEEFFVQGDEEKRLGVPVQAFNDRENVNRASSQIGFIEFLVSPMYFAAMKVLPPTALLAKQLVSNMKTWEKAWISETTPPPTDQEKKAVTERIAKVEQRYFECFN